MHAELGILKVKNYYQYWAKSKRLNDGQFAYHILPFHCLDAAAVGEILIDEHIKRKDTLLNNANLDKSFLKSLFMLFLALHDSGKFSISFQNLQPDILRHLQRIMSNKSYGIRHDQLGWIAYENLLRELIIAKMGDTNGNDSIGDICDIFAQIAFGHHGIPPSSDGRSMRFLFESNDIAALDSFCNECIDLFIPDPLRDIRSISALQKNEFKVFINTLRRLSWELAGLYVIADWIVSAEDFWLRDGKTEEVSVKNYWKSIHNLAKKAVKDAGVLSSKPSRKNGLTQVFPAFADSPTPLQAYCENVMLIKEPQLWILEDVTGSGKTEASLTLASRIISAGLADGVFIALPTMATSNAMYERMGNVYWRLFEENERPSLVLSHGSRHLSEKFRQSYRDHIISANTDRVEQSEETDEGRVHCAGWFADSSKKALLADTGVGTIDQVLLSVLPVRYQSLRYFGMSRKLLILDEVHSYDAYMLRILETVLTGHASAGGSTILLSATLPFAIRQRLVAAYRQGLGEDEDKVILSEKGYPLATGIIKNFPPVENVLETRREVARTVAVELVRNAGEAIDVIKKAAQKEQCACWIRNTVNDVFDAYDLLVKAEGISKSNIDVFHSRFALHDRIKIEKKIINNFGEKSGYEERKGRILLATQVVEQSLDLDFDIIISDLAPIDLLIQRAGRLHRHLRDSKGNRVSAIQKSSRSSPVYYVYIPPETEAPDPKWFSGTFPGASFVYKDTALLWRTKEILKKEKAIITPARSRHLIESVYGDEAIEVPDVFHSSEGEAWEDQLSKADLADFNVLKLARGYSIESSRRWDEEERVPTRLGDAQQNIYLFRIENNDIIPFYSGEYAWEMSMLKVRRGKIGIILYERSIMKKIEEIKKKNRLQSDDVFLNIGEMEFTQNGRKIIYDNTFGLRVEKEAR